MSQKTNGLENRRQPTQALTLGNTQTHQKADSIMPDILLCSGFGKHHSVNNRVAPKSYVGITLQSILAMLDAPQCVEKSQAQWVIFSSLMTREYAEQRANGTFYALWADIDEQGVQGLTFRDLVSLAGGAIGYALWIYTSSTATEETPKSRIILPLAAPVTGEQFVLMQRVLNNKLEASGITPDRATERAGLVCYLPNRGAFYDYFVGDGDLLTATAWQSECEVLAELDRQHQARLNEQRQAAKLKAAERMATGQLSPIGAFNETYSLPLLFDTYGYLDKGKRWLSPNSQSNVAGVTLTDDGRKWLSTHASDADLGKPTANGTMGDAFDLFVYYNHQGDRDAAIKAAGEMFTSAEGVSITKSNQREYMQAQSCSNLADVTDLVAPDTPSRTDPQAENAVDLFNTLKLPPFPLALLPDAIANYAHDQAELIGVDPAVIAMAAIGAAAACIDDRIQIQPKRYDTGWRESARLWVGIIGDPSAKKSPGINKAMAPLFKIDHQWREESNKALAQWAQACDETPKGEEPPPAPLIKRLILNDATVEKMGDILSKSEPRGILSYQDELSGWLAAMDAYKNGAGGKDKAAWLEAYNGGPKAIDRIGRGSTFVENWSACVIGGIQPSVVQAYANATNHDGMLQRFVLLQASEARLGVDRYHDRQARDKYNDLMQHLAELGVGNDSVVTLSAGAHKAREALETKLHRITLNHPNKYLTAALGKWSGLYARLLLVLHCVECATKSSYPTFDDVSEETAQRVADLMWRTLLPHAMRFYNGLDTVQDSARELAGLILAHGWERFTVKRDLDRYWRASRKLKPWEIEETLDRLEAFAWIFPEPGKLNEKGKPAAYLVNPGIHVRFNEQAKRERARRKEVAAMLADIKSTT
tara:strand:- start:41210 stop:43840 length:2631 start_codon:yes stop_codon:yes gene_type:complete